MLRAALYDQQLLCLHKVSNSALQVYKVSAATLSLVRPTCNRVCPFVSQAGLSSQPLHETCMPSVAWHC